MELPIQFLYPWDFPGKNTGVGHHFHLQGIFLSDSGVKPLSSVSPALHVDSLPLEPSGKPKWGRNKKVQNVIVYNMA